MEEKCTPRAWFFVLYYLWCYVVVAWSWRWHEADSSSRDTDPFFRIVVLPKKNTGPFESQAGGKCTAGKPPACCSVGSKSQEGHKCLFFRPASCIRIGFCRPEFESGSRHGLSCFLTCFNTVALWANVSTKHTRHTQPEHFGCRRPLFRRFVGCSYVRGWSDRTIHKLGFLLDCCVI